MAFKEKMDTELSTVAEKYFYKNSRAAYRWKPHGTGQKRLA